MELQRCFAALSEVYRLFHVMWKDLISAQIPLHLPRKQQVLGQQACLLSVQENDFKLRNNNLVVFLSYKDNFLFCLPLPPENYLGHSAKNAVITVPAYFNDSQRQVFTKL